MPALKFRTEPPILKLAVPSPLRHNFDYLPPVESQASDWQHYQPGVRILVPFGRRQVVAILAEVCDRSSIDSGKLRHALAVLDHEPLFSPALLQTFLWAANYYQHPTGDVFNTLLPGLLRQGKATGISGEQRWRICQSATDSGITLPPRAHKQKGLRDLLLSEGALSSSACESAGFNAATRRELLRKGLIEKIEIEAELNEENPDVITTSDPPLPANKEQQIAITAIASAMNRFDCFLLDGVTGSGKTEVYLQVIADVIKAGKQALVLVPEINLTPQTIDRFRLRFATAVVAMHSAMTDSERYRAWELARLGKASIIIGTRSAIFTPLLRPGILIIDEEHDSSFKQQDGFRYSARDLAIVRAREENIPVVLGSATPALESLQNARQGKFQHLLLTERAGTAAIPQIRLLDISNTILPDGFSEQLLQLMHTQLNTGKQVLVFINRRGFAPVLFCNECGSVFECAHCDAQLTVHKNPALLRCHHCDSQKVIPSTCACCGSKKLQTRGMGTQKTEQFLTQEFPGFPVLRIDRDSTRRKNSLQNMLEQISTGNPCILVGTQMLAKGHHLPGITLVAVLDADFGLFSPDFRAQEQMLQLLVQVAGRAGRARNPGQVVIQTRHESHPLLQILPENNYHKLADLILGERKSATMPPFSHLALFRAEAKNARLPILLLNDIAARCRNFLRHGVKSVIDLHGPLPAPLERRAGRYRFQLLLRAENRGALQKLLADVVPQIDRMDSARKVRWSIDVDPLELI